MIITIAHTATRSYDTPVMLAPQTIMLEPRSDALQRVRSYELIAKPASSGRSRCIDLDGTPSTLLWFSNLTDRLELRVNAVVETLLRDPLSVMLIGATQLPYHRDDFYETTLRTALAPYRARQSYHDELVAVARKLADTHDRDVLRFLIGTSEWLHKTIELDVRWDETPFAAEKTLRLRRGSSRDIAVLMMEVCRVLGLAVRLVSGYCYTAKVKGAWHLHAWIEVYLPGAGWKGFDPTLGCPVADAHVACAAAHSFALTAPILGVYAGRASSELVHQIEITCEDAA